LLPLSEKSQKIQKREEEEVNGKEVSISCGKVSVKIVKRERVINE
jgi:hypothetical protein